MFMASYPSGLRGRFAKPLFAGSNPADASFRHSTLYFASDLARVVELVDTTDLKSVGCISRAGSSPAPGTPREKALLQCLYLFQPVVSHCQILPNDYAFGCLFVRI